MHSTIDTLVGVLLIFLASTIAFGDVTIFAHTAINEKLSGRTALAGTVARELINYLSPQGSDQLSADQVLQLASVLGGPSPPPPHTTYGSLMLSLGLNATGFGMNLDMSAPLIVAASQTAQGIAVTVTMPYGGRPAAANLKAYVFDGASVSQTLAGQASPDGKFIFTPVTFAPGSIALVFANLGTATGFGAVTASGQLQDGPLYIYGGKLQGQGLTAYIFSYEDWTGPFDLVTCGGECPVNLYGYSLPAAIVYQMPGGYAVSPYPRLPSNYGAAPTANVIVTELIMTVRIGGSTFVMKVKVWGGG